MKMSESEPLAKKSSPAVRSKLTAAILLSEQRLQGFPRDKHGLLWTTITENEGGKQK